MRGLADALKDDKKQCTAARSRLKAFIKDGKVGLGAMKDFRMKENGPHGVYMVMLDESDDDDAVTEICVDCPSPNQA